MKYDIFISYRRTSFETASLIAEKLKSKGFRVFFDIETLRSGKFNEQLYNVIEQCNDVVIILPENALDRCNNPDDWVRQEVCHAMKHNKNIIPVMLTGFEWPDPMPTGMEELCKYQAITAGEREFFDLSIQRLTQYLSSTPHKHLFKLFSRIAIIFAIATAIILGGYFSFRKMAVPECQNITNEITKSLVSLDLLISNINDIYDSWELYTSKIGVCSPEMVETHNSDMQLTLDHYKNGILANQSVVDSTCFNLSDYQSFLIGLYGIDRAEINAIPISYNLTYAEGLDIIDGMQQIIDTTDKIPLQFKLIKAQKEALQCLINADYYGFLEIISLMPKDAQKNFTEISSKLTNMPNGTPLGLNPEEYQSFHQKEMEKLEQIYNALGTEIKNLEIELSAIEQKLSDIDNKISNNQIPTEDGSLIQQMQSLKESENELDAIKEDSEAQLLEIRKELDATFTNMKGHCQFQKSDDQYYKWGKIIHWANFMSLSCDYYYQYIKDGLKPAASATPADLYNVLEALLNQYETEHPETKSYVKTAKVFYREVSLGKRQLSGTIIMGFKDNAEHPVYKIGDIVIERNGQKVNSASDIQKAAKTNGNDVSTFLRLENNVLQQKSANIPSDCKVLVGYLQLTEI